MYIQLSPSFVVKESSIEGMEYNKEADSTIFVLRSNRTKVVKGNWINAIRSAKQGGAVWCHLDHYELRK